MGKWSDLPLPQGKKSIWNSLEIAKLVVGASTSLAVALLSAVITLTAHQEIKQRDELTKKSDQVAKEAAIQRERLAQVAKHRVALWNDIAPQINDIYCYFTYVGHWREIDPRQIIATKRKVDKLIYGNRPFFSDGFVVAYEGITISSFKTFRGWGKDAGLLTRPIRPLDRGNEDMFVQDDSGNPIENMQDVHRAYFRWLDVARKELDLDLPSVAEGKQPTPPDISVSPR